MATDIFINIREIEDSLEQLKIRVETHLNTMDWEHVLTHEMVNDEEYYPCIRVYEESGIKDIRVRVMQELEQRPNQELFKYFWGVYEKIQLLDQFQLKRLKTEYTKCDSDLTPNLLCSECGYFAGYEKAVNEHACKKTTTCKHCQQNCRTYKQLQTHIENRLCLRAHVCDACNFKTNSGNQWARHIASKAHKELTGFKKQEHTYECIPCGFKTNFKSTYEEHCNRKKHKTLCDV